MSKLEIIELIALAAVVLVLVIVYVAKAIKNKWISQLVETVNKAMKEAEAKYPEGHGAEKQVLVLEAVKVKCEELGIPYTILEKLVIKLIKTVIANYNLMIK